MRHIKHIVLKTNVYSCVIMYRFIIVDQVLRQSSILPESFHLTVLYLYLRAVVLIFSSPEPKAQGELIVWDSSRRPFVRESVRSSTLSNMNISETSWPILIKFHQKHYWDGGLAALGFGPDWIKTLVSMATYSSHRVIMGKTL